MDDRELLDRVHAAHEAIQKLADATESGDPEEIEKMARAWNQASSQVPSDLSMFNLSRDQALHIKSTLETNMELSDLIRRKLRERLTSLGDTMAAKDQTRKVIQMYRTKGSRKDRLTGIAAHLSS